MSKNHFSLVPDTKNVLDSSSEESPQRKSLIDNEVLTYVSVIALVAEFLLYFTLQDDYHKFIR